MLPGSPPGEGGGSKGAGPLAAGGRKGVQRATALCVPPSGGRRGVVFI